MKHGLLLVLAICLFSITSFAQNENFEIGISMENTNLWGRKDLPIKVKITNKSENLLYTKKLNYVTFYFSKCLNIDNCNVSEDTYITSSAIPQKWLKIEESLDFEVNLVDLYWQDGTSSTIDMSKPKNLATIPVENRFLSAVVRIFDRYLIEGSLKDTPTSKSFLSNNILTELKPTISK